MTGPSPPNALLSNGLSAGNGLEIWVIGQVLFTFIEQSRDRLGTALIIANLILQAYCLYRLGELDKVSWSR